ncbi:serine hydrolase domain-containing protein, partial [candidate division KSB1 bacterium]
MENLKTLFPNKTIFFTAVLMLFLLLSTGGFSQDKYNYKIPQKLNDGWEVSSLEAEGLDSEIINEVTGQILNEQYKGIYSYLIVKNGKLVHEVYFKDRSRSTLFDIMSITKSVSSTLIGIAIDKGLIKSVNESVLSLLPQYADEIADPKKQKIKLKHILTISTGLEWYEKHYSYSDPRNSETQMVRENDWMKFVLSRPVQYEPGTVYNYNTGSVHLLSAIIRNASSLYAGKFAEKYLFGPLGIKEYDWNKDKMGYQCTGATHGGIKIKSRDLAKFGQMILQNGKWKGNQIVSEKWVKEATKTQIEIKNNINN